MNSGRRPESVPGGARISPLLAGILGLLVGALLWYGLVRILLEARPALSSSIAEARQAGLVSLTVRAGYDKGQETVAWLLGCLVIPVSAWVAWLQARGPRGAGRRATVEETTSSLPLWMAPLGVIAVALAVVVRSGDGFITGPSPWGTFGLLGEEGVYLGAVQALRTGRVLYADLDFPYGPLLLQPLNAWLWAFGDTIANARGYVLALHAVGIVAAAGVLIGLAGLRRGGWLGLGAAMALALSAPLFLPTLNGVLLRPVLAFVPAALVFAGGRRIGFVPGQPAPSSRPVWPNPLTDAFTLAGFVAGGAVFFSFEIGAVAGAGLVLSLALIGSGPTSWMRAAVGGVVATLLSLSTIGFGPGIPAFFEQAWQMVTLPGLGYQALPYPDVGGLFRDGSGAFGSYGPDNASTAFWATVTPVLVWLALAIGLCRPRPGPGPSAHAPLLATAFVAAVLFRAALGRSDLYHLWFYGAAPSVLLLALLLDRLHAALAADFRPAVFAIAALALLGVIFLDAEEDVRFPLDEDVRLGEAAGLDDPLVPVPLSVDRAGGVEVLPRLAEQAEAVVRRVRQLPRNDQVWFYPSEATYYFLTDRPVPCRFLWAYDAATPALQARAIEDLEASAPRWVVRSTDTFDIDNIPQSELVPQLANYLATHYVLVETLPGGELLERSTP
jgi:hypothetical protein